MEHLVESHMGGYYISDLDPEIIMEYCEECGDSDWIILSREYGYMYETLKEYFSEIKKNKEMLNKDRLLGITKREVIDSTLYHYELDRNIILNLLEEDYISEDENKEFTKISLKSQKNQIALVNEVYNKNKVKTLKKKI